MARVLPPAPPSNFRFQVYLFLLLSILRTSVVLTASFALQCASETSFRSRCFQEYACGVLQNSWILRRVLAFSCRSDVFCCVKGYTDITILPHDKDIRRFGLHARQMGLCVDCLCQ